MTTPEEWLHRGVWVYARSHAFDTLVDAIDRGIISGEQADQLLTLWDERHPRPDATEDAADAQLDGFD